MKKRIIIVLCGLILFVGALLVAIIFFNGTGSIEVEIFSYSDVIESFGGGIFVNPSAREDYLKNFESDEILGPITDKYDALEKAEFLWVEIYGKDVRRKKPHRLAYDESEGVWLVKGSLPRNKLGGVPHILIRGSDGKVLYVWHTA